MCIHRHTYEYTCLCSKLAHFLSPSPREKNNKYAINFNFIMFVLTFSQAMN